MTGSDDEVIVRTVLVNIVRAPSGLDNRMHDRRCLKRVLWGVIEDDINDRLPPNYRAKVVIPDE